MSLPGACTPLDPSESVLNLGVAWGGSLENEERLSPPQTFPAVSHSYLAVSLWGFGVNASWSFHREEMREIYFNYF